MYEKQASTLMPLIPPKRMTDFQKCQSKDEKKELSCKNAVMWLVLFTIDG